MTVRTITTPAGLRFLQSDLITIPHGMFARHGGNSLPPFDSLNISHGLGDTLEQVLANRQLIKLELRANRLLFSRQEHGDRIYAAPSLSADTEVEGYDALITDQEGIGLLIQQADCQAVLIHDPKTSAIGAVHCGWRGSVVNIIGATIARMRDQFGSNPASLKVAISPSLGPCCAEFINYRQEIPEHLHRFQTRPNYFDFWNISVHQLTNAGVREDNIDLSRICTVCDRNYFSYRRMKKEGEPSTGRNGSAICLPEN